jgi:plasmid stabilization system protein ParE
MAAQRKRGGKQILDYLYSDLTWVDHYAADDPAAVRRYTQAIRDRIREDIEPLLMRADPSVEARLKELEEWKERIEAGNITKFRKEG